MENEPRKIITAYNTNYINENVVISLMEENQDKFLKQINIISKRDTIALTLCCVSIAVAFTIFLFGYHLFPPTKTYVDGSNNYVDSSNTKIEMKEGVK